jgi:small-conductance mechanosensitive channel
MIYRICQLFLVMVLLTAAPNGRLWAQDTAPTAETTPPPTQTEAIGPREEIITIGPPPAEIGKPFPDYDAWRRTAQRGERMTEVDIASLFAFKRLRADLVSWRDTFLNENARNSARLETVDAQIAALGPVPDSGTEADVIAARRVELVELQQRLSTPEREAQEAYARANGLIGEVDRLIRQRETARLMERGTSPLNPLAWPQAATALWDGLSLLWVETRARLNTDLADGTLFQRAPVAGLYLAAALLLLLRGRKWVCSLQVGLRADRPFVATLLTLGQFILPLLGLFLLRNGLQRLDIFGFRSSELITAIPAAGGLVVLARVLIDAFFPRGPGLAGLLQTDESTRRRGVRYTVLLAWGGAIWVIMQALIASGDALAAVKPVLNFPIIAILAVLFYSLGRVLRRVPDAPADGPPRVRMRTLIGRGCQIAAVLSLAAAALGYSEAAEALIFPAIMTVSMCGFILFLQRMFTDLYGTGRGVAFQANESLIPILVGTILAIAALPLLALVWGARVDDILEVWTRFREGFQIGDTKLSPAAFLTLILVFVIGYLVTRFLQGTLRVTVLPRTRMDIGGQNAIVSGAGYIGIFLSALIAITAAGIDLSNLAIVAGALSVGIGFGLQNIVQNFVSGIILLIERPIGEGDMIEVGGHTGYVRDISVRSTRIETFDRTDVIIPNADLVSGQVTNWTRGNSVGRLILSIGVAYGTSTEKVTDILLDVAKSNPMVLLNPEPAVYFIGFGDSSLNFEIRAILRDVNYLVVTRSEMNHEIAKRFAAEGIEIPFPQRDLWVRNAEALKPEKDNEEPT